VLSVVFLLWLLIKCYTAADTAARKKLTDDIIGEIAANSWINAGFNLTARLLNMIHNYKLVLLALLLLLLVLVALLLQVF